MSNPFIGDNYFKENPSKILGVQTIRKGRFGDDVIVVEGSLSDIERIEAETVADIDLYPEQVYTTETKAEMIEKVFEVELKGVAKKRVNELRGEAAIATQEVYSFEEINKEYNSQITREELEAYYFTHPELNHKLLFEAYTFTKEDFIQKGLVCFENNKWVYKYTYQSGNISQKISILKRDKDKIGEEQFNRQIGFLEEVRPKQIGFDGAEKIIIVPHSAFAKQNKISELRYDKPKLNGDTTLFWAFKRWLTAITPDNFTKSNSREIIDYYLDNKNYAINKNASKEEQAKQEKTAINIRQRTKEEGDFLFARFLSDELLPEDQAKIAYLWNEKYNSIAEPNLTKIPICLRISKTFKKGAPFTLNPTQRQSAAFMMEKKSGLLAYGVGVGKTASSIACLSQAFYNGLAKKFLFVVPTNTYDKWIGEIQGIKKDGVFLQGLLPQMPPVVGLFNLNPLLTFEKLKDYTPKELKTFEAITEAIEYLKKAEKLTDKERNAVSRMIPLINWNGIETEYTQYTGRLKKPKELKDFIINYLRDEYNFNVYELGTLKEWPDGTIFVTTEIGLQRLGVRDSENLEKRLFSILSQGETTDEKRAKEIATLQLRIAQTVSSSMKNSKLMVEDFGFDWACFDEAHYYKKLFTYVKGDIIGEKENSDGETVVKRDKSKYELKSGQYPSARALSAFLLSHYIQSTNDNRNVIQLTATPFTNSPLEVFSMLTLTNYKALEDMGLSNMVDFFDTFMKISWQIKLTPQRKVVKDVVLLGYNNLPQLRSVIYTLMDKKDEGANLIRPTKILYPSVFDNRETTIPMSLEQTELMKEGKKYVNGDVDYSDLCRAAIQDEIETVDYDSFDDDALIMQYEALKGEYTGERPLSDAQRESIIKAIKNWKSELAEFNEGELDDDESLGVRILKFLSLAKQITLSPYLYYRACAIASGQKAPLPHYKDYVESSPKFKYAMGCIKSVIEFHRERGSKISGQVIYMNAGVEYFPLLKEYLVKELHLKESQVGIVSGGMSKSAKENVKNQFLSGDILVLIGSSTISVGVDLQENASTLYNLYFDWNPTDAAQIEGRIWRQGNRFAFVRIVYPQCYNSADPVIFEYLNQKTQRINEIWNRSGEVQELDLRDFDPKKLQKELITDPEEKAQWEILEESDKVENNIIFFENRRELLVDAIKSFNEYRRLRPVVIQWLTELTELKLANAKKEAIDAQNNKIAELVEKFQGEKLENEIRKYRESRYDHINDPNGKYIATNYAAASDAEIYADCKKWVDAIEDWGWKDSKIYDRLYYNSSRIKNDLSQFRYDYKDMKSAEERVLVPMGFTFENAINPIQDFDEKLAGFREQLDLIKATYEQRVEEIKIEMSTRVIVSIKERIEEFAAANERYLVPQLFIAPKEKLEEKIIPPPVTELINPVAEKNMQALTSKEVINTAYAEFKEKLGEKKAKKYFQQADRLVNPNENIVVQYRTAGVVTYDEKDKKYTLHALGDMDLKNWRVTHKIDVTDQFAEYMTPDGETEQPAKVETNPVSEPTIADIQDAIAGLQILADMGDTDAADAIEGLKLLI